MSAILLHCVLIALIVTSSAIGGGALAAGRIRDEFESRFASRDDLDRLGDRMDNLADVAGGAFRARQADRETLSGIRDRLDALDAAVESFDCRDDLVGESLLGIRDLLVVLATKHDEQARNAEEIGMAFQQLAERIA